MRPSRVFFVILSVVILTACGGANDPIPLNTAVIEQSQISNLSVQKDGVFSSGQPTQQQFELLKKAGIQYVIDLRPEGELDWDEEELVKSLGLHYERIPVSGPAAITDANAVQLHQLLESYKGQPTLVHCSSSNRVGALIALRSAKVLAEDPETAIAEGRRWGMTVLEPYVRERLGVDSSEAGSQKSDDLD